MDEQALTELLECSVCLEQLDHTSKVLPCQHTFCRRCLQEIVSTKHELRCPECRFMVEVPVTDLPTNILLIRLLEGIKTHSIPAHRRKRQSSSPGTPADTPSHTPTVRPHQRQGNGGSGRPCATALFNYEAKDPGDLSFKKSDLVYLCKQVDENWYHGELPNGQHGFFPASYVKVKVALASSTPQCKAIYDFSMVENKEGDCLFFRKDELVTLIRKVDDNWLEGRKGDKIGIFPCSFVELNEPAKKIVHGNWNDSTTAGTPSTTSQQPQTASEDTLVKAALAEPLPALSPHPAVVHNKRHSFTSVSPSPPSPARLLQRRSLEVPSDTDLAATGGRTPTTVASPLTLRQSDPGHSASANASPLTLTNTPALPAPPLPANTVVESADGVLESKHNSMVPERRRKSVDSVLGNKVPQPIPVGVSSVSDSVPTSVPASTQVYVALYNYKPQKDDEVALTKGDYYSVCEKCQDGWFKGICLESGATGVFPGNYVQLFRTHSSAFKPVAKSKVQSQSPPHSRRTSSSPKPPPVPLVQTGSATHSSSSTNMPSSVLIPPRPKTSPGGRALSADRDSVPPPVVPRTSQTGSPLHAGTPASGSIGGNQPKSSSPIVTISSTKPHSPAISTPRASSHHSRPHKSSHGHSTKHTPKTDSRNSSPQTAANKSAPAAPAGPTSASSPVWKHSLSASAIITPPNMVVGAELRGAGSGATGSCIPPSSTSAGKDRDKDKKKDKDKPSLMKRLTAAGKGKKPKSHNDGDATSPGEASVSHNRSGSFPGDNQLATIGESSHHKKTGSFDSSTPPIPVKPTRPKPLMREKFRCVESYPPQGELELELKIGDVIYVHKKRDDGWYKGTLQRSGKTGLFPGSFVEKCDRGEA